MVVCVCLTPPGAKWHHPGVPKWPRGRGASQGRGMPGRYLCRDVPHRAAAPRLPKEGGLEVSAWR
jgi:hypothetical protein